MKQIPFSAKWTIAESDLKKLKDTENRFLQSKYISTSSSLKYWFKIYPNGNSEENRGKVVFFLGLNPGDYRKVETKYTVEVENYSEEFKNIYDETLLIGYRYLDTVDVFDPEKKYILNGKLVITIDGLFQFENDDEDPLGKNSNAKSLGNKLWKKNDGHDCLIVAGDGRGVKAHKLILATKSTVFSEMFKTNPDQNQIVCPDFTFEVIENAMEYIYDSFVPRLVTMDLLISTFEFWEKYNFSALNDRFENCLIRIINTFNVCYLTNCSIKLNKLKLQKRCEEFLLSSIQSKTPLYNLHTLDKDIALKIFQNQFYQDVKTEKEQ